MDLRETTQARSDLVRHPWEEARSAFFRGVLRRAGLCASARSVLDVGAGDGWFADQLLADLGPDAQVTCWDTGYSEDALSALAGSLPPRAAFTEVRPERRFDLLLLLDVLEHVEDDRGFLAELLRKNLEPGGHVLVSVPAWQWLYSEHDARLLHHRRYSPGAIRDVLRGAGLELLLSGGLFHSLLVPRAAQKLLEGRRRGEAASGRPPPLLWQRGAALARLVRAGLALDNQLSLRLAQGGFSLPGLSYFALCRVRS